MKNTAVITTTLSPKLILWLTVYAKKRNTTKRTILEEALEKYRQETRRKEMTISFQQIAKDADMKTFADEGLSDYNTILNDMSL